MPPRLKVEVLKIKVKPVELDEENCKDLMEAFQELQNEVEDSLLKLRKNFNKEEVNCLFRAIHNIKGNAGIMGLEVIVNFTHEIEEVAGALRQGRYLLTERIGEALLFAMDRLYDLHQQELYGKKFDYLRIEELGSFYQAMAHAEAEEANTIALKILQFLGAGIANDEVDIFAVEAESNKVEVESLPPVNAEEKQIHDLFFFQEFALQLDTQIEGWEGRSIQLFEWAMKMNSLAGGGVDESQLAAAVYIHNLGIAMTPREFWEGKLDFSPDELEVIRNHPNWGYNFLVRIPGWEEAATIIYHHRESIDGSGYPNGLKGDEIHPGAKMLSILDAFFFLTKGRVDSSARHSTVRALSTINARIDTQFEGIWVQCFNHMMRKELQAGNV